MSKGGGFHPPGSFRVKGGEHSDVLVYTCVNKNMCEIGYFAVEHIKQGTRLGV